MAEANALIGVEKAAYYPTLSLTGAADCNRPVISKLFSLPALFWSLGARPLRRFSTPVCAKRRWRSTPRSYNADVASYRQTVLTAFQQVEDYIATLRVTLASRSRKQHDAIQAAQTISGHRHVALPDRARSLPERDHRADHPVERSADRSDSARERDDGRGAIDSGAGRRMGRVRASYAGAGVDQKLGSCLHLWRTHSCVPCRDSSRHLACAGTGVGKSVPMDRRSIQSDEDAARTSACATRLVQRDLLDSPVHQFADQSSLARRQSISFTAPNSFSRWPALPNCPRIFPSRSSLVDFAMVDANSVRSNRTHRGTDAVPAKCRWRPGAPTPVISVLKVPSLSNT